MGGGVRDGWRVSGRDSDRRNRLRHGSDLTGVLTDSMVYLGKSPNRRQVLRSELEHELELLPRILHAADFYQCPTERDVRGKIGGMPNEPGPAGFDSFLESPGAPIFLGQRRKGNGRRVRLDPAFQFFDAR